MTKEMFHTETKPAPAAGRSGRTRPRCRLGPGETLIPTHLRASGPSGPSASGSSSPSSTPTTSPDRTAKHARSLVDARPGGKARQHDRALVNAGRTEFAVAGNRVVWPSRPAAGVVVGVEEGDDDPDALGPEGPEGTKKFGY
ncbi:hypothetical protein THAOC_06850 [Thalassiosira oceanica]|uniref:Uncharacterized protein n=1 Tax=Thalassiosira oceanica TaxID=159749 RepID=K0TE45_THAOC|nr:hypothetical protein THAOC_06850 [Thalassiosira oceanica]|eukprot:EJK71686.1 hypothetical protein THAOC_06850 [Thalassiosira oceanica]